MAKAAGKAPETMTKAALLETLGRKWTKAQLVAAVKAANHGYAPFGGNPEVLDAGGEPVWQSGTGQIVGVPSSYMA